ncbi:MAG: hypothetical protein JXA60_01385 [Candidatus Coatesbacteria bacterium]|nr:hypothetical protein [Candidatus Coatesbacteria bacterium]
MEVLSGIKIGNAREYKNMKVYPVYVGKEDEIFLEGLEEALEKKHIKIREESESGNVNNLVIEKGKTEEEILILAGEIIAGAKQNRTIGYDIILGKKECKLDSEVYCVERGRWSYRTRDFGATKCAISPKMRFDIINKYEGVHFKQSKLWRNISILNSALHCESPTESLTDSFDSKKYREESLEYLKAFKEMPEKDRKMAGMLVFINDKAVLLEAFNNNDMLKKYWEKLINSYTQEALFAEKEKKSEKDLPEEILENLKSVKPDKSVKRERADLFEVDKKQVKGYLTILDDKFVHASLFF